MSARQELPLPIKTGQPFTGNERSLLPPHRLLYEVPTKRIPINWDSLQNSLSEELGAKIPDKLIEAMGLNNLHWQMVDNPKTLSVVILGSPEKRNSHSLQLEGALATVEIRRSIDDDSIVRIQGVRLGGLKHDSRGNRRIVGVAYYTYNRKNILHGYDVSVLPSEPPFNSQELYEYTLSVEEIPTRDSYPYYTAALITQAMVDNAGNTSGMIKTYSSANDGNFSIHTAAAELNHFSVLSRKSQGQCTLIYGGRNNDDWDISVPLSLDTI